MSLETGTRIPDLVPTNPVGATDFVQQGDDHLRLIKACLQGSFPAIGSGQVTATAEEISELASSGVTNADLVKLHALTATAAELNYVDGVTSAIQAQLDSKIATADVVAGYQPLDADLTALSALTTASYGRNFLELTSDADLATKIAAMVPTWTGLHKFKYNAYPTAVVEAANENGNFGLQVNNASASRRLELGYLGSSGSGAYGVAAGNSFINALNGLNLCANDALGLSISTSQEVKIYDANTSGMQPAAPKNVAYSSPGGSSYTLSASDNNSIRRLNGITTLNCPAGLVAGANGTILNDSGASCSIVGTSSGRIFHFTGAARVGPATRTLAYGGIMSWVTDGSDFFIFGSGIS